VALGAAVSAIVLRIGDLGKRRNPDRLCRRYDPTSEHSRGPCWAPPSPMRITKVATSAQTARRQRTITPITARVGESLAFIHEQLSLIHARPAARRHAKLLRCAPEDCERLRVDACTGRRVTHLQPLVAETLLHDPIFQRVK